MHAFVGKRLSRKVMITIKKAPSVGSWSFPVLKRGEREAIQGGHRFRGEDQAGYHY